MAASSKASKFLVSKTKKRLQGKISEIADIKEGIIENTNSIFLKVDTLARDTFKDDTGRFLKRSEAVFRTLETVREAFFHLECQLAEFCCPELECVVLESPDVGQHIEMSVPNGAVTKPDEPEQIDERAATAVTDGIPYPIQFPVIPEPTFKKDVVYNVILSAKGSPSSFALVLDGNSVLEFLGKLTDYYHDISPLTSFPPENSFVVCKYGGIFCRAKFSRDCMVLVDSGDLAKPVLENLFPLHPKYADVPAQALQCCLRGIIPAEGNQWSARALIRFAELTEAGTLSAKFAKLPSDKVKNIWEACYAVELFVDSSGHRVSVNEDLVRLLMARKVEPEPKKVALNPGASEYLPSTRLSVWSNNTIQIPAQFAALPAQHSSPQCTSTSLNVSVPEFLPRGYIEAGKPPASPGASKLMDSACTPQVNGPDAEGAARLLLATISGVSPAKTALEPAFAPSRVDAATGRCTQSPYPEVNEGAPRDKKWAATPSAPDPVKVTPLSAITSSGKAPPLKQVQTIKPRPLPKIDDDTVLNVIVTEIISPSHFYIHIDDEVSAKLLDLGERLSQICPSLGCLSPSPDRVHEGSFWAVFSKTDQTWVRVEVTAVSDDTVDVTYVDFGCQDSVGVSELRPLLDFARELPSLAIRAKLDCVQPSNGDAWTSESIEAFRSLVGDPLSSPKLLFGVVLSSDEVEQVIGLGLLEKTPDGEVFINNAFVDTGFAVVRVPEELRPLSAAGSVPPDHPGPDSEEEMEAKYWNPMEEHYHSGLETFDLDGENVDSLTKGYVSREKICRFFARNGRCYKGETCLMKHVRADQTEDTEDFEMVYANFPTPIFPRKGDIVYLQVSAITKRLRFYAIFPHGVGDVRLPRAAEEDPENLETLQKALQDHYDKDRFTGRMRSVPALGELVVAKSSDDQKWYRGKVVDDIADGKYRVFFVDLGHVEVVDDTNLRKPCAQFMYLPPQAYECILANYETANPEGIWDDKAVKEFRKLVESKDLVAEVVDHEVTLLVLDLFEGESNIGQALVSRGLATYRKYQPYQGKLPG